MTSDKCWNMNIQEQLGKKKKNKGITGNGMVQPMLMRAHDGL